MGNKGLGKSANKASNQKVIIKQKVTNTVTVITQGKSSKLRLPGSGKMQSSTKQICQGDVLQDPLKLVAESLMRHTAMPGSSSKPVQSTREFSQPTADSEQCSQIEGEQPNWSRMHNPFVSNLYRMLDAESIAVRDDTSQVDGKDYPLWQQSWEDLNIGSEQFYISQSDTHLGLELAVDAQLNCSYISVLRFHKKQERMLVRPCRFLCREKDLYESKLFFNGGWRAVEITCKKHLWSAITTNMMHSLFRDRQQEEYLYRLLAWLPERIETSKLVSGPLVFGYLKQQLESGKVLIGTSISHSIEAAVLAMPIVQSVQYMVIRLGAPCALVEQFQVANIPKSLRRYLRPESNVYIVQWEVVRRQYCSLQLSWQPTYNCIKTIQGRYSVPEDPFLKICNFNDHRLSHYGSPQHILTVPPHFSPLFLRIVVERHISETCAQESLDVMLYRHNNNTLGRRVYVTEPLHPISYSSHGQLTSCSYLLPSHPNRQQSYCLVLLRKTIQVMDFHYTIGVFTQLEVEIVKVPQPPKTQSRYSGKYTSSNWGESIYSPRMFDSPMYRLQVTEPMELEIKLQTKDKQSRLLLLLYQLSHEQADPLEEISHNFDQFVKNVKTSHMSYVGLSYLAARVERSTYVLIPLLLKQPEGETPYSLEVNCFRPHLQSRITITELSPNASYRHSTHTVGSWLNPLEMSLHRSNQPLTINSKLLDSGCVTIFKLEGPTNISCWLVPLNSLKVSLALSIAGDAPPSLSLAVIEVGHISGRLAGRKIYSSDFAVTCVGLRTSNIRTGNPGATHCAIISLCRESGPYKLTVLSDRPLNLQRATTAMTLQ